MKHILTMQYPSSWWHDMWREGLVTGNGVTGVNLYGGAKREILQLGRHDLWYDGLEGEVPDVHEALSRQRRKMTEGSFQEASWEIVNALKEKGYDARLESHIPVANLTVEQTPVKGFRFFQRCLDMERALASQQWLDDGIQMRREVFVSRAADMAVYRLSAEKEGMDRNLLEYLFELSAFRNEGERPTEAIRAVWDAARTEAVCVDGHTGYLYFNSKRERPDTFSGDFGAVAKISVVEGGLEKLENRIKVKAAGEILVTICLYVDEKRENAWQRLHDRLEIQTKTFEELLAESAELHKALYHSAELRLGQEAGQEESQGKSQEESQGKSQEGSWEESRKESQGESQEKGQEESQGKVQEESQKKVQWKVQEESQGKSQEKVQEESQGEGQEESQGKGQEESQGESQEKGQEESRRKGQEETQEASKERNQEEWSRTNEDLVMEAFSDRQSVELIEKLWHYGRYLFICGSSPATNPFPLYGLWGGRYRLQWCHNMANENLQMIYWHSMCGNLIEYNQAVFRYMNDRIPAFTENAQKLFGIDGIYMTAGTTPGVSSPTQVVPVIINWVGAAGWLAQHYYQYFLYTGDMDYARNIMIPYMDGVAGFYEEFVQFTTDDKGRERIRFYPSVSPENTPVNFMPPEGKQIAHPMPTTINSTIDLSIIKEFFTNMLKVSQITGVEIFPRERTEKWNRILRAIPEFKTNGEGAVKEWQEDLFEDRYDHRHLSHIYPVFPGYDVYPEKDPDKIQAYEKAVSLRKIDAQTGWSMAHMAALHARFRNGAKAMECLDNMARSSLLNNFFTLHNDWRGMNISLNMDPAPVQLDAIMGYVNAVQEMILYAAPGYIALLPALEERLSIGEIRNFRYSDGLLHMKWNQRKNKFFCEIMPLRPHKVQVVLPDFVEQGKWQETDAVTVSALRDKVWEVEFEDSGSAAVFL